MDGREGFAGAFREDFDAIFVGMVVVMQKAKGRVTDARRSAHGDGGDSRGNVNGT